MGRAPVTHCRDEQRGHQVGATLATVAQRVGFANAFALSAAFKREHGVSPSEYRTRRAGTKD